MRNFFFLNVDSVEVKGGCCRGLWGFFICVILGILTKFSVVSGREFGRVVGEVAGRLG